MANNININVRATVDKAVSEVDRMKAKLNNLSTSEGFKSAVMGVGVGAGVMAFNAIGMAVGGATQMIQGAITAASNLSESTSKAQVVFGASIAKVTEFGQTSAKAFGISKQAAYEATSTFGNLFGGMGLGQEKAADMSVNITKLAADLASFNNVSIDEALGSLRSGLVGEAEPMRKFGVLLNEAAVKAEGMKMGLANAKGELSDAAKVQARYALIVGQTTTAQGDFSRTADGLANSQRSLNAELADVTAEIGTQLMPVVRDLAVFARDDLVPSLKEVAHWLSVIGDVSQGARSAIATADYGLTAGRSQRYGSTGVTDYGVAGVGPDLAALAAKNAAAGAAYLAKVKADADAAAAGLQQRFEAAMRAGQAGIQKAVKEGFGDTVSAELTAGAERANGIATTWSKDMGVALGAGEPDWMASINALGADMKSGMTKNAATGYIMGTLNTKMIAAGLKSGKPGIAAETSAVVSTMLVTLDKVYGPAMLATWNFGSDAVNTMARAMAAGQLRAFGNASPGMAPVVAAAPKQPTGDSDFKRAYADAVKAANAVGAAIGGSGGGSGGGGSSVSAAATDAKAKLKQLADDAKTNLGGAFDRIKTSAQTFFDDLHNRTIKAKTDAHDLANAQLDAQIGSINATVDAARAALQATRDARQLASLQTAVGAATDPASQEAAQTALSDFQAEQAIRAMEKDAQVKIDALTAQKKANDDSLAEEIKAEDARYKAQTKAYDDEMKALQTYLDKHPKAWKASSDQVLAVMKAEMAKYADAGADLTAAFDAGRKGAKLPEAARSYADAWAKAYPDEARVAASIVQKPPTATAGSVNIAAGAIVVTGNSDPAATATAVLQALRREVSRQAMTLA